MVFAQKIKILRLQAGLSEQELADRASVSYQRVVQWESGAEIPELSVILTLSDIFGVSTDTLLKDSVVLAAHFDDSVPEPDPLFSTAELPPLDQPPETPKKPSNKRKVLIVCIIAVCIVAAAVIPAFTGTYSKVIDIINPKYPYVLVHGLGGWGSEAEIDDTAHYWGADAGSLSEYLTEQGYTVCEPTVGPFSSAWDRACELYASLTGTRVDYGEAHSKKHSHERYGRTYATPMVEDFGKVKVNLVGHSFGGNTIRLFTHLLENGAPEEKAASGENTSPLFTGGKADYVNSIVTLCSPHNGSTLYYISENYGITDKAIGLIFSFAGLTGTADLSELYDFQLEQFGITNADSIGGFLNSTTDNAVYDLSPEGSAELNRLIQTPSKAYCFSYSYCTTEKSPLSTNQVPRAETLTLLKTTAILMGRYSKNTVSDYKIDETWLPNDGLVNVVSAEYPFDEEHVSFNAESIRPSVWNVMPVISGDHCSVIGLGSDAQTTRNFYLKLFTMIDSL